MFHSHSGQCKQMPTLVLAAPDICHTPKSEWGRGGRPKAVGFRQELFQAAAIAVAAGFRSTFPGSPK